LEITPYKLLLIDASSRCILLVEGPGGKILAELPVPKEFSPQDMKVIPLCHRAVISLTSKNGSGTLRVIDLTTFTFDHNAPEIPCPTQISPSLDATCVYLTDPKGQLYRLKLKSGTLTAWGNPSGEGRCRGLANNDNHIYGVWETPFGGMLAIFNHEGTLEQQYPLGGVPTGITLDQDGRVFIPFTATSFSGEGVFMLSTYPAVIILNCCHCATTSRAYPLHVTVDQSGKIAYVLCEDNATIAVIDIPAAKRISTINVGRSISRLELLPHGKFAVASSNAFADLSLIDLINARLLSFTESNREILSPFAVIQ
jgi:DNA-binding beta-propeller fold protein YncE